MAYHISGRQGVRGSNPRCSTPFHELRISSQCGRVPISGLRIDPLPGQGVTGALNWALNMHSPRTLVNHCVRARHSGTHALQHADEGQNCTPGGHPGVRSRSTPVRLARTRAGWARSGSRNSTPRRRMRHSLSRRGHYLFMAGATAFEAQAMRRESHRQLRASRHQRRCARRPIDRGL